MSLNNLLLVSLPQYHSDFLSPPGKGSRLMQQFQGRDKDSRCLSHKNILKRVQNCMQEILLETKLQERRVQIFDG